MMVLVTEATFFYDIQELRVDGKQHFLDSYHQIKPITEGRKRREKRPVISYAVWAFQNLVFFFARKKWRERRASEHTKLKSSEFSE